MELGNISGVKVVVPDEYMEEIKRQKTIEENEILKEQQERIDKAIEYIKNNTEERKIYEPYGTPTGMPNRIEYYIKNRNKLLNILEGE